MSLIDDIRLDIGDDGATQRYTDSQLIDIVSKSARRINRRLSLKDSNAILVSASGEITQPSDVTDELEDLVLLQAECLLYSRDTNSALTGGTAGVFATDGEQSIDTRNRATAFGNNKDSITNPCVELERALLISKLNLFEGYDIW